MVLSGRGVRQKGVGVGPVDYSIFAEGVDDIDHVSQRLHAGGVELAELLHVCEDAIELPGENFFLVRGEAEAGQDGDAPDFLACDLHPKNISYFPTIFKPESSRRLLFAISPGLVNDASRREALSVEKFSGPHALWKVTDRF